MARRHIPGLTASVTQIAFGLAGFIVAIVLLDSGGLAQWAERLDVGPLRAVAAPATANIDAHLRPLGVDAIRPRLIAALGRLGWSDDPAALAASGSGGAAFWPFSASPPATLFSAAPPPIMFSAAPPPILSSAAPPPGPPVIAMVTPPPPVPPAPAAATPHESSKKPADAAPLAVVIRKLTPTTIVPSPAIATTLPAITPLPPLGPIPPGHPRQVALVGDSMMAVGLSAVLLRTTATDPKLRIVKAFRSGTGLARPDVFDWFSEYPAMIGHNRPDVVIVAIGANDAQGYVDRDGQILTFGSDAWVASYRRRVAAFMDLLESTGRQIIWMGLPPMKSPVYDAHTAEINRITYTVVSGYPNAVWWNPTPYIGSPDGSFRDLGEVETPTGHRTIAHLRADDGIHLSDDGASLLTEVLLPCLEPLPLPPPPAPPPG
jgi:lysophospholipase L1-like esterase